MGERQTLEWPTLGLILLCYLGLFSALWLLPTGLAIVVLGPLVTLHASLTHEVVHGHPTPNQAFNAALVFPAVTLVVPYARFAATHRAHHHDERLTDPYEDPETNYIDPDVWGAMAALMRAILSFNARLVGRLTIGPLVGQIMWMASDMRACRNGDRAVLAGWLLHLPALALMLGVIWAAPLPFWAYALGAYFGLSILRLRTYLEHRADARASARTVVIEDRGLLALLFLNNNLHVVHHMHPTVPWYRLPALYAANRAHYLRRNGGYRFASYAEVLRRYFWRAKDSVPHPIWRKPR